MGGWPAKKVVNKPEFIRWNCWNTMRMVLVQFF